MTKMREFQAGKKRFASLFSLIFCRDSCSGVSFGTFWRLRYCMPNSFNRRENFDWLPWDFWAKFLWDLPVWWLIIISNFTKYACFIFLLDPPLPGARCRGPWVGLESNFSKRELHAMVKPKFFPHFPLQLERRLKVRPVFHASGVILKFL